MQFREEGLHEQQKVWKDHYGIALALVAVMLIPMFLLRKGSQHTKIPEAYKDRITVYENEDYIYVPEEEHLKYDEEECQFFPH